MNADLENRFSYHAPHGDQSVRYERIRAKAKELAYLLDEVCPKGREVATALTQLDSVVFFANAAVARNPPREQPAVVTASL